MGIPIIGDIIKTVGGIAGKFITDKDKLAEFEHELDMTLPNMDLAQMEVNKVEAAHASIFVAGWRPFIGWVCGIAFAYHFIIRDWLIWAFAIWWPDTPLPPQMDLSQLSTILMGILGLGTLRTYEKMNGVARNK